jgi:hypothetical protein
MKNPYFSEVRIWRITGTAISDSVAEILVDGRDGNEGIVLWLGHDDGDVAEVTHLVRLRGPNIERFPDLIDIQPLLINEVADLAIRHEVRLVGQIHSHGPNCPLDLSVTDREYGIKAPQYLSVVAPNYGNTAFPIHSWGVHVFVEGSGYWRLSQEEAEQRLRIAEGPHLPFLTAGGFA